MNSSLLILEDVKFLCTPGDFEYVGAHPIDEAHF